MTMTDAGSLTTRARIVRHESARLRFEIAFGTPDARLRSYVHEYVGGREESVAPIRRREVPSGNVPMILNFTGRVRERKPGAHETWREHGSFTAGLHDGFTLVESVGASHGLQVTFNALGARLVLRQPLHELTNTTVAIQELLGARVESLMAELYDAPSWDLRFAILDRFIGARVMEACPPPAPLVWAWQELVRTGGRMKIGVLVDYLGSTEKTFVARFRHEFGVAPKTFARILRFSRALHALTVADHPRLSAIAYEAGYYDQAHFAHDFRAFAGVSPTELLASRLPGGAGVLAT